MKICVTIAVFIALTGCFANPTPHPSNQDSGVSTGLDTSSSTDVPSAAADSATNDPSGQCATDGGFWNESEMACDFATAADALSGHDSDTTADAHSGAPDGEGGDGEPGDTSATDDAPSDGAANDDVPQ